ncbi:MAG TPA: hypothetical protein VNU26_03430 [Mycobacteriales bacterium]|nr:hypothetical protein [Mycobacteriales bacterium]
MVHPLDEYAVHQAPVSLAHPATSDRNFYDRCIFHALDPSGDRLLVVGGGVYPNLGVEDAYAALRTGSRQTTVRASGALRPDRLQLAVGPLTVDVVEPLTTLRLRSEAAAVSYDLRWTAVSPAFDEPLHVMRDGNGKKLLEGCRFAQTGEWHGTLTTPDGTVDVDGWAGTRDRSWGIRPVGAAEPTGRPGDLQGFWWTWAPLRFEDSTLMTVLQEQPDGFRTLGDAVRVWHDDGRIEQLGWPEAEIRYASGTRHPLGAVLRFSRGLEVEVETRTGVALAVGCGYGGDPDWAHGTWRGDSWTETVEHDYDDDAVRGRTAFSVVDHWVTARITAGRGEGQQGVGIFEHASMGRHDPSGFADWSAVAP